MYPRNAASPPRIAIGAVVQISDGAVQSSGVSVVVRPEGGSESAGGGTISYGGSSNVVYYQPTQAETDYTAFVVTAYKTGCVPVSVTVITTASATAGYGGVDWSKVTAATTTVNLSGTTISTSQAVASVSGAVGSVTGNVGGNVVGSVGSLSGYTAPDNAGITAIKAKTDNLPTDPADASDIASAFATVSSEIAAIKAKTDNLPASPAATSDIATALGTGTWATAIPWNAAWDAEVQSECTDALNAYDPPTNAEMEARTLAAASYATAATQTTIVGHVDTLETEIAKVIKSGESRTIARAGETSITFTETRA